MVRTGWASADLNNVQTPARMPPTPTLKALREILNIDPNRYFLSESVIQRKWPLSYDGNQSDAYLPTASF